MFDLPEPLGPTSTFTPLSKLSWVGSANDLKPFRRRAFTNMGFKLPAGSEGPAVFGGWEPSLQSADRTCSTNSGWCASLEPPGRPNRLTGVNGDPVLLF